MLDEYETSLHDAYVHDYYKGCRGFIAPFLGKALKGNDFVRKALITGILKMTKSILFSELNNVEVYTLLDSARYADCFGFTEGETNRLLERVGLQKRE